MKHAASVGRDMLVVAKASAEVVALFVVTTTEGLRCIVRDESQLVWIAGGSGSIPGIVSLSALERPR